MKVSSGVRRWEWALLIEAHASRLHCGGGTAGKGIESDVSTTIRRAAGENANCTVVLRRVSMATESGRGWDFFSEGVSEYKKSALVVTYLSPRTFSLSVRGARVGPKCALVCEQF